MLPCAGIKTHVFRSGIAGTPPLFVPDTLYTAGELIQGDHFDEMRVYPPGTSTDDAPASAVQRAGNMPPSLARMLQVDDASRGSTSGGGDAPIATASAGRGVGPLLKRGGPLRQWDSQVCGRGERDSVIARMWRMTRATASTVPTLWLKVQDFSDHPDTGTTWRISGGTTTAPPNSTGVDSDFYAWTQETMTIASGGSGYTNGDVLTVTGGDGNAQFTVSSVSGGGAITGASLTADGTNYSPGKNGTTGGTGTGRLLPLPTVERKDCGNVKAVVMCHCHIRLQRSRRLPTARYGRTATRFLWRARISQS